MSTLLDSAPANRTWPPLADAVDLLVCGMRERLALNRLRALDRGLRLAALIALPLAAGLSVFCWLVVEPITDSAGEDLPFTPFGSFYTCGPAAYATWVLAALVWLATPRWGRAAVGLGVITTLALVAIDAVTEYQRPPAYLIALLTGLGIVACAGLRSPASLPERLVAPVGTGALIGVLLLLTVLMERLGGWSGFFYRWTAGELMSAGCLATLAVMFLIGSVQMVRRLEASWLWATLILAVPVGWVAAYTQGGPQRTRPLALFVLVATVGVLVIAVKLASSVRLVPVRTTSSRS